MKRIERYSFVPGVAFTALCFGVVAHAWIEMTALLFGVVPVVLAPSLSHRFSLDRIGQLIVGLLGVAVAYFWFFVVFVPPEHQAVGTVHVFGKMGALWCIGMATIRLYVAQPLAKEVGTAIVLMFALLFLGIGNIGVTYLVLMPAAVCMVLLGVKWEQQYRAGRETWKRQLGAGFGVMVVAALVSAFFIVSIPKAYQWTMSRYVDALSIRATGFSSVLSLGSVRRMLVSKKVVMRVYANPSEVRHLRGTIYNTYRKQYWTNSIPLDFTTISPLSKRTNNNEAMTISPVEQSHRYFLPLNMSAVRASQPVRRDQFGVVVGVGNYSQSEPYSIELTDQQPKVLAPVPDDLVVPKKMMHSLSRLLESWGVRSGNDAANAQRLVHLLKENYQYSLTFERPKNQDALLNFLLKNKKGHCEYFASAFALLARTIGIPTRVAGGYYLGEYNPMGGYYIVREQHAHTWVEAWINGEWRTVEATPPGGITTPPANIRLWLDTAWVKLSAWKEMLFALNKWVFVAGVFGLVLLWMAIRIFRKRSMQAIDDQILRYGDSPVQFLRLQHLLEQEVPQKENESIEHWVNRFDSGTPRMVSARKLLLDYSAWRYGGHGSIETLTERCRKWIHGAE